MDIDKSIIDLTTRLDILSKSIKDIDLTIGQAKTINDPKILKWANNMKNGMSKDIIKLRTLKAQLASEKVLPGSSGLDLKNPSILSPTIAVGIIFAVASITATILYKRFLSKAAKACKDKSGKEKSNCMTRYKIDGYVQAIRFLKQSTNKCSQTKKPEVCKAKIKSKISTYEFKIKKYQNKLKENIQIPIVECYIKYLYDPDYQVSKEIQGSNIPVEGDDRPNWIRECMMVEGQENKINCLRKLREQTAMNPFYQYRIDRFIDAITQTYEPTDKPGMVPEVTG